MFDASKDPKQEQWVIDEVNCKVTAYFLNNK
jgi:hypothetical protein